MICKWAVVGLMALAQAGGLAAERGHLSRADLPRLKKADRGAVFAALGSFDDRGLGDDTFIDRALGLLDARRIPGLREAMAEADRRKALDAVFRVCRGDGPAPAATKVSPAILAKANDALRHIFDFYGERHQLPAEIDWDANPGTRHWGHDLNRFSFLDPLLKAYLATRDQRYSRKAVDLILDWIEKSDASRCFKGTPYVWGSYLNNASHCQMWCRTVRVLAADGEVGAIELLRILKSVHDQLAYLEIVTGGHAGNWPTIGMGGMLECVAVFPILRDHDRFVDYCIGEFRKQIADQVLPDGVQDELTPHYHRVVVGNILSTKRSLLKLGRELDPRTIETLGKMIHYLQQTTVPDGRKQVAFNDSDPGTPGNYARALEELGLARFISPPSRLGPELFPFAGVAFLRQRHDKGDLYLAFDAGPYGRSHQHEDRLGFWLFAYGRNFLVDPGRHLYDMSERSYYPYLKSTAAHSTIRIDGQDQNSRSRPDLWIAKQPLAMGWAATDDEVRASGAYELGYGPDNEIRAVHRREIVFVREKCWVIFDMVEGSGEHAIESRFQFAAGAVRATTDGARTEFPEANLLLVARATAPFTDVRIESGQDNPRRGWYSDAYNKIEPAPALSQSAKAVLPWRAATLLLPYKGTAAPRVDFRYEGTSATIRCDSLGEQDVRVECRLP